MWQPLLLDLSYKPRGVAAVGHRSRGLSFAFAGMIIAGRVVQIDSYLAVC
jgi:hypothetical protein